MAVICYLLLLKSTLALKCPLEILTGLESELGNVRVHFETLLFHLSTNHGLIQRGSDNSYLKSLQHRYPFEK